MGAHMPSFVGCLTGNGLLGSCDSLGFGLMDTATVASRLFAQTYFVVAVKTIQLFPVFYQHLILSAFLKFSRSLGYLVVLHLWFLFTSP